MTLTMDQQERRLGELLDAVERESRKDVYDYTNGHLNESNLYKAPEFYGHKSWKSSKHVSLQAKKKTKGDTLYDSRSLSERGKMVSALADFAAVERESFLPSVKRTGANLKLKRSESDDSDWGQNAQGTVKEQALVEELDSHQLMLNRLDARRTWAHEDVDSETQQKHAFFKIKAGATKRDQYKDFKSFETKVIRKHDLQEKDVLSGKNAVAHMERKLDLRLRKLGDSRSTRFHRLQAHSEVMEELVDSSSIFGYLLRRIKNEYDNYVTHLLDNHPTQSQTLRTEVEDLYQRGVSNPKQLAAEKKKLAKLENEGRQLLEHNDRLREALGQERIIDEQYTEEDHYGVSSRAIANKEDYKLTDLADQLQDLHSTIVGKLDKLDIMRRKLREEYVPTTVCQNLEQCLKDTEIEVQKLLKQNEIFEKNTEQMQQDIAHAIVECDSSDQDRQRLWSKINKVRIPGHNKRFTSYQEYSAYLETNEEENLRTNLYDPTAQSDSSDNEEELQVNKWNWYIS